MEMDKNAVNAAFAQPDIDGTFRGDFAKYLDIISRRRPSMIFTFPPKSAGTFLCRAAVVATNGNVARVVQAQGGREAQFYLPVFISYYYGGMGVGPIGVHAHMLARPGNCRFFEALNLKPIIMIRSVPDMLASLSDMFDEQPEARFENISGVVPEDFPDFSHEKKADYLMDMIGPWYVNYYASWLDYITSEAERVLVLHYTDLLRDPLTMLQRCLEHSGIPVPENVCRAALGDVWKNRGSVRFNKGIAGRGRTYFSAAQLDRLARMMGNYPILNGCLDELLG